MKPSEFVDNAQQETSVFDRSRTGQSVQTERWDEPGDERPKPGDGSPVAEAPVLNLAVKIAYAIIQGDTAGDWSWKPGRDKRLGDKMVTFAGVPKGAAEVCGLRVHS